MSKELENSENPSDSQHKYDALLNKKLLAEVEAVQTGGGRRNLAYDIERAFGDELGKLAKIYIRLGNVAATRVLFENGFLDVNAKLNGLSSDPKAAELLKTTAQNAYGMAILFMQLGAITPDQLEQQINERFSEQYDEMRRAIEDARKPGFLKFIQKEPERVEGVYPAAREKQVPDFEGSITPVINIGDVFTAPVNDIAIEDYHPLINADALKGLEDMDTRGMRASDLSSFIGMGREPIKFCRDTFINDINGAADKACRTALTNQIYAGNVPAIHMLAELALVDVNQRLPETSFSRTPIEATRDAATTRALIELGADAAPLFAKLAANSRLGESQPVFDAALDVVKRQEGFDINYIRFPVNVGDETTDEMPLLVAAAYNGNADMVRRLIRNAKELHLDPNAVSDAGLTVTDAAIECYAKGSWVPIEPIFDDLARLEGLEDTRPMGRNSLSRAIARHVSEAIPLATSLVDPTGRHNDDITQDNYFDSAARAYFTAKEHAKTMPRKWASRILDKLEDSKDLQLQAVDNAERVLLTLQQHTGISEQNHGKLGKAGGDYKRFVALQQNTHEYAELKKLRNQAMAHIPLP